MYVCMHYAIYAIQRILQYFSSVLLFILFYFLISSSYLFCSVFISLLRYELFLSLAILCACIFCTVQFAHEFSVFCLVCQFHFFSFYDILFLYFQRETERCELQVHVVWSVQFFFVYFFFLFPFFHSFSLLPLLCLCTLLRLFDCSDR